MITKPNPTPADSISNVSIAEKAQRMVPAQAPLYSDEEVLYYDEGHRVLPAIGTGVLDTNIFIYSTDAHVSVELNHHRQEAPPGTALICPSQTQFAFHTCTPQCHLLCLSDAFLLSVLQGKADTWYRALYLGHMYTFDLNSHEASLVTGFYHSLLRFRMDHKEVAFNADVTRLLLQMIIVDLLGGLQMQLDGTDDTPPPTAGRIVSAFVALLSRTEMKHRPVSYYAEELCISPKHLARVCRQQTGQTAAEWITRAVKKDIERYLSDPALPLKEIADRLGFGSASFFGRYVQEKYGCTPATLRHKLCHDAAHTPTYG